MRYVPNILTCLRIAGAAGLLLLPPLSLWFLVVYALCGLTDVLDGYIARRQKCVTKLGAALDSAADLAVILCTVIALLPILDIPLWLIIWVAAIFLVRCVTATVGFVKFHALAFIHTVANKVAGVCIFLFPLWYAMFGLPYTGALLCGVASVSAVEELIIVLTSKELDTEKAGLFWS